MRAGPDSGPHGPVRCLPRPIMMSLDPLQPAERELARRAAELHDCGCHRPLEGCVEASPGGSVHALAEFRGYVRAGGVRRLPVKV